MRNPRRLVLSIDGGGAFALMSLYTLHHIMKDSDKKPCQQFDLICGTGTGGLIAILLGHYQMSLVDCIKKFEDEDKTFQLNPPLSNRPQLPILQRSDSLNQLNRNVAKTFHRLNSQLARTFHQQNPQLPTTPQPQSPNPRLQPPSQPQSPMNSRLQPPPQPQSPMNPRSQPSSPPQSPRLSPSPPPQWPRSSSPLPINPRSSSPLSINPRSSNQFYTVDNFADSLTDPTGPSERALTYITAVKKGGGASFLRVRGSQGPGDCSAVYGFRATVAAEPLFAEATIKNQTYYDQDPAQSDCNTTQLAIEAARKEWPGQPMIVLSIGAGGVTSIKRDSSLHKVARVCLQLMDKNEAFAQAFNGVNQYKDLATTAGLLAEHAAKHAAEVFQPVPDSRHQDALVPAALVIAAAKTMQAAAQLVYATAKTVDSDDFRDDDTIDQINHLSSEASNIGDIYFLACKAFAILSRDTTKNPGGTVPEAAVGQPTSPAAETIPRDTSPDNRKASADPAEVARVSAEEARKCADRAMDAVNDAFIAAKNDTKRLAVCNDAWATVEATLAFADAADSEARALRQASSMISGTAQATSKIVVAVTKLKAAVKKASNETAPASPDNFQASIQDAIRQAQTVIDTSQAVIDVVRHPQTAILTHATSGAQDACKSAASYPAYRAACNQVVVIKATTTALKEADDALVASNVPCADASKTAGVGHLVDNAKKLVSETDWLRDIPEDARAPKYLDVVIRAAKVVFQAAEVASSTRSTAADGAKEKARETIRAARKMPVADPITTTSISFANQAVSEAERAIKAVVNNCPPTQADSEQENTTTTRARAVSEAAKSLQSLVSRPKDADKGDIMENAVSIAKTAADAIVDVFKQNAAAFIPVVVNIASEAASEVNALSLIPIYRFSPDIPEVSLPESGPRTSQRTKESVQKYMQKWTSHIESYVQECEEDSTT